LLIKKAKKNTTKIIHLGYLQLAADQSFGVQFRLGADTFDEFMKELEDGKFNKKDKVSKLLKEAFSRGINLD